jgi:hypothetical protein
LESARADAGPATGTKVPGSRANRVRLITTARRTALSLVEPLCQRVSGYLAIAGKEIAVRYRISVLCAVAALSLMAPLGTTALAAKHDPSCTVNPSAAAANQTYTINASGLPTVDPVWLITTAPDGTSTVATVAVNADGTASVAMSSAFAGRWAFVFSGLLNNNKYGTVASCSVQVS